MPPAKPKKVKDIDTQAWLDYLESQVTGLATQVEQNTEALLLARSDLDRFLTNAAASIESIDLVNEVMVPLLLGDNASAKEVVRRWGSR